MARQADAQIEAQRRLRVQMTTLVNRNWDSLEDYTSDAAIAQFLSKTLPVIESGKRQSVLLTRAYIQRQLGRSTVPVDVAKVIGKIRAGTPPATVYSRPIIKVRTDLSNGALWRDAVAAAGTYAANLAQTDMQLAQQQAAYEIGQDDPGIRAFERVLDADACDLCIAASAQVYSTDLLMPIHGGCHCLPEPIEDGTNLPAALAVYYDKIGRSEDADKVRAAKVQMHGELGPVLTKPGDHFTSL